MTKKSPSTITNAEIREIAKTRFRKTPPLVSIEYNSQEVAMHLWMANIARSWLQKSKSELRKDLEKVFTDPDPNFAAEFRGMLLSAQQWFADNAEMMQAAIARSAVAAAANLADSIEEHGDLRRSGESAA